ncbi:cytochrome P450 [Hypomontagnella monticulosa]|nr:cytochrome P450 [Hypomontagnella monticulosa]
MYSYIPSSVLYAVLALVVFYLGQSKDSGVLRYVQRRINAWRYLFQGADMITAEYKKAGGKAFEVLGPDHGHVFVSSKEHIGEIRKAPRSELSMFGATRQMFQPTYTMLGHNWHDERGVEGVGYVRAVGTLFPRQLLRIMPDMQRIVGLSFEEFARANKSNNGHLNLPAYELSKKLVCKLNGFCFFGDELAQNESFMKTIFQYNELVISAAEVLRVMPWFLKPIIGPYVGRITSIQDKVFDMINDLVTRRLKEKKLAETGEISTPPPNDMIQWIIDTAPAKLAWGPRRITHEIIAIWFGSVHALSATITYVLFDLCDQPEYIEPLRKEVEGPEFDHFMSTTKGLSLLDSFMKESSRLSPIEAMSGRRQALKDYTFSDGTRVKKGDWACVPAKAILRDETHFPHATRFEGFRFAPRDEIPGNLETVSQPEGPSRYSDLSDNYHSWGVGGIVCPGRFYAAVATKLIVAHILKNFDCSIVGQVTEKSSSWRSYLLPKEGVHINFSPRKQEV